MPSYTLYQGDPPTASIMTAAPGKMLDLIGSSDNFRRPIHHIAKNDGGTVSDVTKKLCLEYLDRWCQRRSILDDAGSLPDIVRGLCEAEIAERQQNMQDEIRHERTERTY